MVAAYLRAPPATAPRVPGCTGKVRMKQAEAEAAVRSQATLGMAYKCQHCHCWHVSKWTKEQVRYAKSLPTWVPPA